MSLEGRAVHRSRKQSPPPFPARPGPDSLGPPLATAPSEWRPAHSEPASPFPDHILGPKDPLCLSVPSPLSEPSPGRFSQGETPVITHLSPEVATGWLFADMELGCTDWGCRGKKRWGTGSRLRAGTSLPEPPHSCMAPQGPINFHSNLPSVQVYLSRQEDGTYII